MFRLIVFDERVTLWLQRVRTPGHCLVRVRMLLYLQVGSRIIIVQARMQTIQQTHMHKVVTVHVEA